MKYSGFGVDGGSTYFSVSYLGEDEQLHPFITQGMDSPYLPSIVAAKTRKGQTSYLFAAQAKTAVNQATADRPCRSWTGWKLLLAEENQEMIAERGYTAPDTPEEICRRYYQFIFSAVAQNFSLSELEEVAIGVPESWLRKESTYDARTQLLDICKSLPQVKRVRLVSEPVAACAYFVHKYRREAGRPFRGHCFVFDAGGGTLDLTVCEADENGPRSRIRGVFRNGVGENTDRTLGASGIAYMEMVVLMALAALTGRSEQEIVRGPKFQQYVRAVEATILGDSGENLVSRAAEEGRECTSISDNLRALREIYYLGGMDEAEEMKETAFSIDFNGLDDDEAGADEDTLDISYGLLMGAYDRHIAPVIRKEIAEVRQYLDEKGIPWTAADAGRNENSGEGLFRIILCGGFCNFPLVEAQVKEEMGWQGEGFDPRFSQQLVQSERAMAVSYGLTLAANHVIEVIQTSPFSVGFCALDPDGKQVDLYSIRKDDVVREGQPCYLLNADGTPLPCGASKIDQILINLTDNPAFGQRVPVAQELQKAFTFGSDVLGSNLLFFIGFSLDESLQLSLHIVPVESRYDDSVFPPTPKFVESGTPQVRRLGTLHELYDGLLIFRTAAADQKGEKSR
ncbi:MAG TPA: hypothetical protein IAB55_08170 [Candidatus Merdivicinus faecavium]|nr:hypothetical protein [Candidatus Merdivicinus faecavium]